MEIRWSIPAAEDLERICERIDRDNPEAARRVARTISDGCVKIELLRIFASVCEFLFFFAALPKLL